jgi:hypothetical protein
MTVQFLSDVRGNQVGVQVLFSMEEWISNKEKFAIEQDENTLILNSIREGLRDVKQHTEGKITLKSLQEVIDEL